MTERGSGGAYQQNRQGQLNETHRDNLSQPGRQAEANAPYSSAQNESVGIQQLRDAINNIMAELKKLQKENVTVKNDVSHLKETNSDGNVNNKIKMLFDKKKEEFERGAVETVKNYKQQTDTRIKNLEDRRNVDGRNDEKIRNLEATVKTLKNVQTKLEDTNNDLKTRILTLENKCTTAETKLTTQLQNQSGKINALELKNKELEIKLAEFQKAENSLKQELKTETEEINTKFDNITTNCQKEMESTKSHVTELIKKELNRVDASVKSATENLNKTSQQNTAELKSNIGGLNSKIEGIEKALEKTKTDFTKFTADELKIFDFSIKSIIEDRNKKLINNIAELDSSIVGHNSKTEAFEKDLKKLREDHDELAHVDLKRYVSDNFKQLLSENEKQINKANFTLQHTFEDKLSKNATDITNIESKFKNILDTEILVKIDAIKDTISGTEKSQKDIETKLEAIQSLQEKVNGFREDYKKLETELPEKLKNQFADANFFLKKDIKMEIYHDFNPKLTELESEMKTKQDTQNEEIKKTVNNLTEDIKKIEGDSKGVLKEFQTFKVKAQRTMKIWQSVDETPKNRDRTLPPPSPLGIANEEEIRKMSVRDIREKLTQNSVDCRKCNEKTELVEKLTQLWKEMKRDAGEGEVADENTCLICMNSRIDCVLLECGHMVSCHECGQKIKDCPVCRMYVTRVVRTYRP